MVYTVGGTTFMVASLTLNSTRRRPQGSKLALFSLYIYVDEKYVHLSAP